MTILCSSLLTNLSIILYYVIVFQVPEVVLIIRFNEFGPLCHLQYYHKHIRRFKLGLSFINSHNLSNVISIFNQTQRSFTLYGLRNEQFSFWGQKLFFVRESVTEWKFKTVLASSWVFPIRWNCAFVRSLRLSLNSLCFSFHFSSSRKAIHYSFIHISTLWRTLHAHSISFGSAERGITPLLIALFFAFFQLSFPFACRLDDQCCWILTIFSLFDSRSIKWM